MQIQVPVSQQLQLRHFCIHVVHLKRLALCKPLLQSLCVMADQCQMDAFSRGTCWVYRHPPGGAKPLKLTAIQKLVKKTIGKKPTVPAISMAAHGFKNPEQKRGRKVGQRATTKQEDAKIIKKFFKLRPPGTYIDSRILHKHLPKQLKQKVGRKTLIRRCADKGLFFEEKNNKNDPDEETRKKRVSFCRKHQDKNCQAWQGYCQGVADLSESQLHNSCLEFHFPPFPNLTISSVSCNVPASVESRLT